MSLGPSEPLDLILSETPGASDLEPGEFPFCRKTVGRLLIDLEVLGDLSDRQDVVAHWRDSPPPRSRTEKMEEN